MPEVLDLRELGGDEPGPADLGAEGGRAPEGPSVSPSSPWRRRAAVGVVIGLFGAVAFMLTANRPDDAAVAIPPASVSSAEQAGRGALDAWARFASTGDLNQVTTSFDPAGPQLERLRTEAPTVRYRPGEAPYAFSTTVRGAVTGRDRDEELVTADVIVSRPGETDQHFAWELVLRRSGGRWLLWTVRDRGVSGASTTRGTP